MIPGLGSGISDYDRIVDALGRGLYVVGLDNRGAGRSEKPDLPYTIEMMADDAAALLQTLGIGPVHVLGHSMGGRIALDLALRHPDHVKSLILVSTGARAPPETRRRVRFLGALSRRNPVLQRLDKNPQPYYAFLRQFDASRMYDATARLQEIAVPTLILHGATDRLAPRGLAEEMHSRIRGSKMVTVPGGHLAFFFRPVPFMEAITSFLGALSASPPTTGGAPTSG